MSEMTIDQALAVAQTHHHAGRLREAEGLYRQILQHEPRCIEALHLLGTLAGQVGRFDASADLIRKALAIRDDYPQGWNNLGNALRQLGQEKEAIAAYQRALELAPDYGDAYYNLGNSFQRQGKLDEAIGYFQKAIELQPRAGHAWNNLGNVLSVTGRLDEALAAFERAMELMPDLADARGNYANTLRSAGRWREALPHYRRALEIKPDLAYVHSNYLYTLHFSVDCDGAALLAEHKKWAAQQASALVANVPRHDNDRSPDRRLKIGYVSPDFREHSVGRFLLPLLENHDHTKCEIVCFASLINGDTVTERFREAADKWHDTGLLSDQALAELILRERIDILVDLSLHMAANRMLVFARKPAPVQVTYLAYPSTSGLPTMDYRLTDPFLDPPGNDALYVEESVRLKSYWCYRPFGKETKVGPVPALQAKHVTFGCLNNFAKVSDEPLAVWAKVLDAVPGSKLLIAAPAGSHRKRVSDALGADRVQFVERVPAAQYLETYHRIDIALDPFPYCGGTTTCDALWMGVPVITLAGKTAVGRGGVSLLNQVGLNELVAQSTDEYVSIARELAHDLTRLAGLRAGLRERMTASRLCDAPAFARDIEEKFRWMWQQWCITHP